MGAVGGLLGTAGGVSGTGISGPKMASIENAVSKEQIDKSYKDVQGGMTGQQNLLTALQGQNGLANQSQNYNQLQGVINGTGPNPAQAMLNQSTGQNVANQAALMAGQRGAGANVGLMARQAGQQGANTQQQAAGQAATLQANQSLNAIGAAGQMANTQAGQQIGQTNTNQAAQQAQQNALLNANQGFQTNQVQNYGNVNNANASMYGATIGGTQKMVGGLMNGAGGMMGGMGGGGGGQQMAGGMDTADIMKMGTMVAAQGGVISSGPRSGFHQHMMAHGGSVPVLLSPGEKKLTPDQAEAVKSGANPMAVGSTVPGKPKVGGARNSYANDTVKDSVPEGTIIVPRSVTQGKNPERKSAEFVAKILAKRK